MQGFTHGAITDTEKTKLRRYFDIRKKQQSQWTVNIGQGTGSRCVLEGYVKDTYYARFNTHGYH